MSAYQNDGCARKECSVDRVQEWIMTNEERSFATIKSSDLAEHFLRQDFS